MGNSKIANCPLSQQPSKHMWWVTHIQFLEVQLLKLYFEFVLFYLLSFVVFFFQLLNISLVSCNCQFVTWVFSNITMKLISWPQGINWRFHAINSEFYTMVTLVWLFSFQVWNWRLRNQNNAMEYKEAKL